jgi:hypothetical protein
MGPIGDQATGGDEEALEVHRGQFVPGRAADRAPDDALHQPALLAGEAFPARGA